MKAVMEDAAKASAALGFHDVAAAFRAAFVDDVSTSLDDMEKNKQLKTDLQDFLQSRSLPIKGFALTGIRPDASLSPTDNILVECLYLYPETDMTQLHTPVIYQGRKVKGRFKNGTKFLTDSTTKRLQHSTQISPSPTYSAKQLHFMTKVGQQARLVTMAGTSPT